MSDHPFPTWLDARLVPDAAFGAAYDAVRPEERGLLKTAIARIIAAQTECACPEIVSGQTVRTMRQGFVVHEHHAPAAWAVVFWDAAYAGPSRILAALLPALLAGVPDVLACRVTPETDTSSFSAPVLAALELAGQEAAACLAPQDAARLVHDCCGVSARGRVVFLGGGDELRPPAAAALRHGVPVRHMAAPVRIGHDERSLPPGALAPDGALRFAHPDAELAPFAAGESGLAALFCGEESLSRHLGAAPLVLCPGQEMCWVWADLDSAFFREKSRGFAAGPDHQRAGQGAGHG